MQHPVHLKACFYYKNLQALWASDNIQKKDKYDKDKWNLYYMNFTEA
jgi:hypothetical protein